MAQKISDYTAITGGVFDDDDLFDVSEHTGSGIYQTRSITGAEIKASISGGSPIATADQVVSTTGTRKITLGGSLVTDLLKVENAAAASIIEFQGTKKVSIPTGRLAINTGFAAQGQQFAVASALNTQVMTCYGGGYNTDVFKLTLNPIAGSYMEGFYAFSSNVHASVKTGFVADITGGNSNIGIDIRAGEMWFGGATTDKIQFYGGTAVVQAAAYTATDATATDGTIGTADTLINNLRTIIDEIKGTLDSATGVGLNA